MHVCVARACGCVAREGDRTSPNFLSRLSAWHGGAESWLNHVGWLSSSSSPVCAWAWAALPFFFCRMLVLVITLVVVGGSERELIFFSAILFFFFWFPLRFHLVALGCC